VLVIYFTLIFSDCIVLCNVFTNTHKALNMHRSNKEHKYIKEHDVIYMAVV